MTDEVLNRCEELQVLGLTVPVMAIEHVLTTKLLSIDEHDLDYAPTLEIARALREQINWHELRERTKESPYARAFFTLVEELHVAPRSEAGTAASAAKPAGEGARVRVLQQDAE